MTLRAKRVSWAVIVIAVVFGGGYLLHYGQAAYHSGAAPAPPPSVEVVLDAAPKPAATAPAQITKGTPQDQPPPSPPVPTPPTTAPATTGSPVHPPAGKTPTTANPTGPEVPITPPQPAPAPSQPDTAVPQGTPSIKWEETEYDFGSVYQQESPSHEFVFTNVGTAPLQIGQVVVTCSCSAGKIPEKPIPPGGKGSITITMLTGRQRGKEVKYVFVTTNDPADPRSMLTIKAEIKLEVDVIPSGVYFGSLKLGDSVERPVIIRPVEAKSFRILGVKSEHPLITVGEPEPAGPPEPEGSYRLMVKIGPADKVGQINSRLVVRTDLPHQKELLIPIYGRAVDLSGTREIPRAR